jgi:hypothetical protein
MCYAEASAHVFTFTEVSPSPRPKAKLPTSNLEPIQDQTTPNEPDELKQEIEPLEPLKPLATLNDKVLITIEHPPTGQENRFKVKNKHIVERVLARACNAFGIDSTKYVIFLVNDRLETDFIF